MIAFTKMNGAGNDFVVIDNRDLSHSLDGKTIERLCDRNRGVGADGLLMVEPPQEGSGADYTMRYYNADGGEAEMCGNGARCFARFVNERIHEGSLDAVSFTTPAGLISATFPEGDVCINLSEPFDLAMNLALEVEGEETKVHSVNTGVPHAVVVVDGVEDVDLVGVGSALRYHQHFAPAGTNANVMEVRSPGSIAIRTYERGVEDETLACGTGMVANAIVHNQISGTPSPIEVLVKGGDTLKVGFEREGDSYKNVTLTGPADLVFDGEIEI